MAGSRCPRKALGYPYDSSPSSRILFACIWLFSVVFTCLACLPVYSVAWMAVPNPGDGGDSRMAPLHETPANKLMSEIMNIGGLPSPAPLPYCNGMSTAPQIAPLPTPQPTPQPALKPEAPSPEKSEEKSEQNKRPHKDRPKKDPICCCDYSDVDESFFSVLNGIFIAISFVVSLPWYLVSRCLEHCLAVAHWMIGSTISHPLTCVWGYSFLMIVTVWIIDAVGGFSALASSFCAWLALGRGLHTKVIAHKKIRVIKKGTKHAKKHVMVVKKPHNHHDNHKEQHHHHGTCKRCKRKVIRVQPVPAATKETHAPDKNTKPAPSGKPALEKPVEEQKILPAEHQANGQEQGQEQEQEEEEKEKTGDEEEEPENQDDGDDETGEEEQEQEDAEQEPIEDSNENE